MPRACSSRTCARSWAFSARRWWISSPARGAKPQIRPNPPRKRPIRQGKTWAPATWPAPALAVPSAATPVEPSSMAWRVWELGKLQTPQEREARRSHGLKGQAVSKAHKVWLTSATKGRIKASCTTSCENMFFPASSNNARSRNLDLKVSSQIVIRSAPTGSWAMFATLSFSVARRVLEAQLVLEARIRTMGLSVPRPRPRGHARTTLLDVLLPAWHSSALLRD